MSINPKMPPTALASKRKEYSVSGLPLSWERKGMMGPTLPVRHPTLKRTKEYIARYIF